MIPKPAKLARWLRCGQVLFKNWNAQFHEDGYMVKLLNAPMAVYTK